MDKKMLINVVIGALIALAIGAVLNKLFFSSILQKIGKKETYEQNYEGEEYEALDDEDEE